MILRGRLFICRDLRPGMRISTMPQRVPRPKVTTQLRRASTVPEVMTKQASERIVPNSLAHSASSAEIFLLSQKSKWQGLPLRWSQWHRWGRCHYRWGGGYWYIRGTLHLMPLLLLLRPQERVKPAEAKVFGLGSIRQVFRCLLQGAGFAPGWLFRILLPPATHQHPAARVLHAQCYSHTELMGKIGHLLLQSPVQFGARSYLTLNGFVKACEAFLMRLFSKWREHCSSWHR
mmetsp:Transcript_6141/g.11415  ORF Transcript_6141/g.11415 Transcript_6141/m.11415 type:complete len:232 (-) Transcript_6141:552-1247(-)